MTAVERKVVHLKLKELDGVQTRVGGDGAEPVRRRACRSREPISTTELADLYDVVVRAGTSSSEADWLVERLGPDCTSVLEPGCGAGRMFEPLARRGLAVTGNRLVAGDGRDRRAGSRGTGATVVARGGHGRASTSAAFDGAICPINTLGHLSRDELSAHLRAMARALRPGGRYLVQLAVGAVVGDASRWEVDRDGQRVRATWTVESRAADRGTELHRSVFEVLAGPRAGQVHEQLHEMTYWTPGTWSAFVAASPLDRVAVYDGAAPGRPQTGFDATGGLLWHELVRP